MQTARLLPTGLRSTAENGRALVVQMSDDPVEGWVGATLYTPVGGSKVRSTGRSGGCESTTTSAGAFEDTSRSKEDNSPAVLRVKDQQSTTREMIPTRYSRYHCIQLRHVSVDGVLQTLLSKWKLLPRRGRNLVS